jgi:uncharacterized protein YggE
MLELVVGNTFAAHLGRRVPWYRAQAVKVDLIALASHGHSGLAQVFYGSVAAGVLQRVDRPLLLIRSQIGECKGSRQNDCLRIECTKEEEPMKKSIQVGTVLLFLLLVVMWLAPALSPGFAVQEEMGSDSPQRTISVSGNGQVDVQPDVAVVTLGVQTEAEEAALALTRNSQQMQALVDALKDAGVAAEDIQTRVVRLYPRYAQAPEPQGQGELIGYTATNIVEVRVRDLDSVGEILDTAVQAGGNRIESIGFEVSDPAQHMDKAREAAWNDAQHKAEQLAGLAGAELGAVLTISESGRGPQPVVERPVMAAEAAAAVPIEAGSQTIEVDLQVTWLLRGEE